MMKYWTIFTALLLTCSLCSQNKIEQDLQNAINAIYDQNNDAIGILLHVESPDIDVSWSGAAGISNATNSMSLNPDQPILIASSIKTYVSASILKLVEQGKVSIEQPIGKLISNKTKNLLIHDGYDLERIKVKHLMSHTSGVWNYANQEYIDHKQKYPNYRWTRDEQLLRTVELGDPVGVSGGQFHYSDANYLLLTEIIESLTKLPFYEAIRELLNYKANCINNTWFPTLEASPMGTKKMAHQYWGKYAWDSHELDISWDLYGGGGIAATTKDMALFMQNYFNSNIVKNDSIKNLIFTELKAKETELYPYYLGLSQDNYYGMNGYGHGGFWGTVMMYFPKINTSVAVCILDRDKKELRRDVLDNVMRILLDQYEKKLVKNNPIANYLNELSDFSGSILVAHKDSVIERRAYGLANIEYGVKNEIDTRYNLASINKFMTSIGVMQLVEDGKILLNATVGTYLPNYKNQIVRDSVTIHHLLTHTSGIPPFYGKKYMDSDKLQYRKVDDYIALFEHEALQFSPGERYKYSGSGFVVLGKIIEVVTGMTYYEYMKNNVFEKAGMRNTLAMPVDSLIESKANGYTSLWGNQSYYSRNDYHISKASPSSSHYSTVYDVYLFSKAIRNGTLINQESKELLYTPKKRGYNTFVSYGMDIDQRYDEQITGHSGGWFGVRTELMDFSTSKHTVVVLSNKDDDGNSGASKVIEDIKEIIAGVRIIK